MTERTLEQRTADTQAEIKRLIRGWADKSSKSYADLGRDCFGHPSFIRDVLNPRRTVGTRALKKFSEYVLFPVELAERCAIEEKERRRISDRHRSATSKKTVERTIARHRRNRPVLHRVWG